mmetsp:Transcript_41736/g.91007  ORF Transcript_41736/g.91007 Transcript_41736/m.91007 type:complete len:480 (+) Transcript_41736:973-2412(+)
MKRAWDPGQRVRIHGPLWTGGGPLLNVSCDIHAGVKSAVGQLALVREMILLAMLALFGWQLHLLLPPLLQLRVEGLQVERPLHLHFVALLRLEPSPRLLCLLPLLQLRLEDVHVHLACKCCLRLNVGGRSNGHGLALHSIGHGGGCPRHSLGHQHRRLCRRRCNGSYAAAGNATFWRRLLSDGPRPRLRLRRRLLRLCCCLVLCLVRLRYRIRFALRRRFRCRGRGACSWSLARGACLVACQLSSHRRLVTVLGEGWRRHRIDLDITRVRDLPALDTNGPHAAHVLEQHIDLGLCLVQDAVLDPCHKGGLVVAVTELRKSALELCLPIVHLILLAVEAPAHHVEGNIGLVHVLTLERPERLEERLQHSEEPMRQCFVPLLFLEVLRQKARMNLLTAGVHISANTPPAKSEDETSAVPQPGECQHALLDSESPDAEGAALRTKAAVLDRSFPGFEHVGKVLSVGAAEVDRIQRANQIVDP